MNTAKTVYDYIIAIDSTIDNDSEYIGYSSLESARSAILLYVSNWYSCDDQTREFRQELSCVSNEMTSWTGHLGGTFFQIVRRAVD